METKKIENGLFISIEGSDGSGKTTAIPKMKAYLESLGYEVITTREPGGSKIAEQIRHIVVNEDKTIEALDPVAQLLLFTAARLQHLKSVIIPALEAGKIVITDRYSDSTAIFQGKLNKMDSLMSNLYRLYGLNQLSIRPDYTFFFDVTLENSKIRSAKRGLNGLDIIHLGAPVNLNALYKAHFNKLAKDDTKQQIRLIDANLDQPEVSRNLLSELGSVLGTVLVNLEKGIKPEFLTQYKLVI